MADEQLTPVAMVYFDGGPYDGLEFRWPHEIDFPAVLIFGQYLPAKAETAKELIDEKRTVRYHRYDALDCWSAGEVLEDGLPRESWQSYFLTGQRDEPEGSIRDNWESC